MRAWSSAVVGGAAAMAVCLQVETTILQCLERLWEPCATKTLWGAILGDRTKVCWLRLAGIQRRRRQIGTDLDLQEFDSGAMNRLTWICRNSTAEATNRHSK